MIKAFSRLIGAFFVLISLCGVCSFIANIGDPTSGDGAVQADTSTSATTPPDPTSPALAPLAAGLPPVPTQSFPLQVQIELDASRLFVLRADLWPALSAEATPTNAYFLVLVGVWQGKEEHECYQARRFELWVDGETYQPAQDHFAAAQKLYKIDYPGSFMGQCIDSFATASTFIPFDIPAWRESLELTLDDQTVVLNLDRALTTEHSDAGPTPTPHRARVQLPTGQPTAIAVALVAATPTRTSTPTRLPTRTPSPTPLPTRTSTPTRPPTSSPTSSPTSTLTPHATATATDAPDPLALLTPTATPRPTSSRTGTPPPTATTPPANTPTPMRTRTPAPTPTPRPTTPACGEILSLLNATTEAQWGAIKRTVEGTWVVNWVGVVREVEDWSLLLWGYPMHIEVTDDCDLYYVISDDSEAIRWSKGQQVYVNGQISLVNDWWSSWLGITLHLNHDTVSLTSDPVTVPTPAPLTSASTALDLQATVTGEANLRSGPGTTYAITGSAQVGQTLHVIGCNNLCDWYLLASGNWIAAPLVTPNNPAPPTTLPAAIPAVVADPVVTEGFPLTVRATQAANLRSGPGTGFDVAGGVSAGDTLVIAACNPTCDWYQLDSGAWIAAFLVEAAPSSSYVPATPSLSPNAGAFIPGLAQNTVIQLLEQQGLTCGSQDFGKLYYARNCELITDPLMIMVVLYSRTPTTVDFVNASVMQFETPSDQIAIPFLATLAALPFGDAQPDQAKQWVEQTIPTILANQDERYATFGGVQYQLFGWPPARTLHIGDLQ